MPEPQTLAANLDVLGRRDPSLAAKVQSAPPPASLDVVSSRTGRPVPRLRVGERMVALHSTVDPLREAERATQEVRAEYVLSLGLGGGYQLAPLLRHPETQRILVLESDASLLRGMLSAVDLRAELRDPRMAIAVTEPAAAGNVLLADYLPAVYRSFRTFPLRARVDADLSRFAALARAAEEALSSASRDYAVQSRFGLRWLRNTVANLRAIAVRSAPGTARELTRIDDGRALVTGAGPSLGAQIPRLRELRGGSFLIATDASLIPLLAAGITPDLVLSIDCQQVVYHHFFAGLPATSLLGLDIASPPFLGRLSRDPVFFSTLHPLARYLTRRGLRLPYVDVTGGNVTHAAVFLADSLGAREIRLFGVDLSYPSGTPYARGCFLYPALAGRSSRIEPLEGAVAGFVLGSPSARRVAAPLGRAHLTGSMETYRAALRELALRTRGRVLQEPGLGPPLDLPHSDSPEGTALPGMQAREEPEARATDLLPAYAREVEGLPPLEGSFCEYLTRLDGGQREALATLLPVVAARQAALGYPGLAEALPEVKQLVLRALRGGDVRTASIP